MSYAPIEALAVETTARRRSSFIQTETAMASWSCVVHGLSEFRTRWRAIMLGHMPEMLPPHTVLIHASLRPNHLPLVPQACTSWTE